MGKPVMADCQDCWWVQSGNVKERVEKSAQEHAQTEEHMVEVRTQKMIEHIPIESAINLINKRIDSSNRGLLDKIKSDIRTSKDTQQFPEDAW